MAEWVCQQLPGEQRLALMASDQLVELELRRSTSLLRLHTTHQALVQEKVGNRWRAEIDGTSVWLTGATNAKNGDLLHVHVVRAPIPEPGQIKLAHVAPGMPETCSASPHILKAARPEQVELIEAALDQAITGRVPFPGGQLSLERTRAGLVIDVDGTGPALAINQAAAAEIARVLRLFQVGGMVMVDFIGLQNRAERLALDQALATALHTDPRPAECTAMNGFGLVQIVRPRPGPSVIDILCGTWQHAPSIETQALRLLADAAHSRGAGPRTITAHPAVVAQLKDWPALIDAAAQACGAAVKLVADTSITGYGHVHVTPL